MTPPQNTEPSALTAGDSQNEASQGHVKPLARESLREDILRAIKAAILTAELEDGQLYTMVELAERFGASRTPVREALLELEKRGLVEIIRSVGFRITAPTREDLRDMLEIREFLEIPALVNIAGSLSESARARAEELIGAMEQAAQAGDIPAFHELDRQFHVHLVAQTGNERLVRIVDEAREIQWIPGLRDSLAGRIAERNQEHQSILSAVLKGDRAEVERLIRAHLDFSRRAWGVAEL